MLFLAFGLEENVLFLAFWEFPFLLLLSIVEVALTLPTVLGVDFLALGNNLSVKTVWGEACWTCDCAGGEVCWTRDCAGEITRGIPSSPAVRFVVCEVTAVFGAAVSLAPSSTETLDR